MTSPSLLTPSPSSRCRPPSCRSPLRIVPWRTPQSASWLWASLARTHAAQRLQQTMAPASTATLSLFLLLLPQPWRLQLLQLLPQPRRLQLLQLLQQPQRLQRLQLPQLLQQQPQQQSAVSVVQTPSQSRLAPNVVFLTSARAASAW